VLAIALANKLARIAWAVLNSFDLLEQPLNAFSPRQSPASSSISRIMCGDRTSERVARMIGSSARKKRSPWRTATPRSNRKARI
jgi:hypothetical protein